MELTSTAFDPDGTIPERHARPGGDVSPPLAWTGVPATANDLVLTCTDPDAPGGTFVHWLLGGIQPDRDGLDEGEHPDGATAGRNGFGDLGYGGPEPPVGDDPHRYVFRLHALAEPIELEDGSSVAEFEAAIDRSVLDTAELVGRYGRR